MAVSKKRKKTVKKSNPEKERLNLIIKTFEKLIEDCFLYKNSLTPIGISILSEEDVLKYLDELVDFYNNFKSYSFLNKADCIIFFNLIKDVYMYYYIVNNNVKKTMKFLFKLLGDFFTTNENLILKLILLFSGSGLTPNEMLNINKKNSIKERFFQNTIMVLICSLVLIGFKKKLFKFYLINDLIVNEDLTLTIDYSNITIGNGLENDISDLKFFLKEGSFNKSGGNDNCIHDLVSQFTTISSYLDISDNCKKILNSKSDLILINKSDIKNSLIYNSYKEEYLCWENQKYIYGDSGVMVQFLNNNELFESIEIYENYNKYVDLLSFFIKGNLNIKNKLHSIYYKGVVVKTLKNGEPTKLLQFVCLNQSNPNSSYEIVEDFISKNIAMALQIAYVDNTLIKDVLLTNTLNSSKALSSKERHFRVAHIRKLSKGHKMSEDALKNATCFGVVIPKGYTFVSSSNKDLEEQKIINIK